MHKLGSFLALALVTLVVVLAAIYVQRGPDETIIEERLLFPGLSEKLNRIAQVRISKGESVVELRRQGENAWSVPDRTEYPADLAKIHELLLGTAGLERLEQKTSNPERYGQLGLAEVVSEEKGAMQITIQDEEGQSLADFFLGKRGMAKGRRARDEMYVRIRDEPVVWLVEGNLPYGNKITDWLQKDILTLDQARIRGVRITHPDGEEVIVRRNDREATNYQLIGLPEAAEPKSVYAINSIASSMANLQLQDVHSIKDLDLSVGKTGAKVLLTTFDGMRITMETWQIDEDIFVRINAGFDAALVHAEPKRNELQGEQDSLQGKEKTIKIADAKKDENITKIQPSQPKWNDTKSVEKEANTLYARWRNWAYILPKYQLNNITKRMSDLIKEPTAKSDHTAANNQRAEEPTR
uniref:DUF4340 domain-containing protein n=1 Tax=Candidatus Kentrum sp. TUN TaxID=2126343 RepID=A0A451ADY8_9GAMM|nr:MAG: protein of unknown function (DUF4340) [Candidatus Kentron sp. TUN]